ncbi:MAG TPA: phosphatidylglycerophosphatase A [Aliidongia sp.]|uniref:phosphatidylglycerophosphatase A family protein n=1 Tax=Aliidongia sp. TaxID=1914230 RepID=UPI002DDD1AD8|nr:phosphatidylglycerophosphatase A [Aliidongia sp.]HEV2678542.1 phosphatidylglycerophosphatase A [Aliidongia sp.]
MGSLAPARLLATWFGAGLAPKAPGTWGSVAALPFAWAIQYWGGSAGLVLAASLLFVAGWIASDRLVSATGIQDPQIIVVDEVVGQWLTLACGPLSIPAYLVGLLLFRAADITKPFPASWADRSVDGGLGVMLDDVLAAVYSGLGLWLIDRVVGL